MARIGLKSALNPRVLAIFRARSRSPELLNEPRGLIVADDHVLDVRRVHVVVPCGRHTQLLAHADAEPHFRHLLRGQEHGEIHGKTIENN